MSHLSSVIRRTSWHLLAQQRRLTASHGRLRGVACCSFCLRHKSDDSTAAPGSLSASINRLFVPVPITPSADDINVVGEELAGKLDKPDLLYLLNKFYRRAEVRSVAREHGLDKYLFHHAFVSFKRFCLESEQLPPDLHILLVDILRDAGHPDDIIPFFLQHARSVFPHLECLDDLRKISDLREPANWYPQARALNRRIVFHAGPTNSGKTYNALERFMQSESGVYCGPLKLLAAEVFDKCRARGVACDLVTGEERRLSREDGQLSSLVACTVEMTSVTTPFEVAVIDEIQMLRDPQRGWAWTRCFLGVIAKEVHVCGEPSALPLIEGLAMSAGEDIEVRRYDRLTPLSLEKKALGNLSELQPGDCVVCFSKNDIYNVSREVERMGRECAVIYGSLPPGVKRHQSQRFNDPNNQCDILVATDAIGMGLNLNIRRVIFKSLTKPCVNERGEKEIVIISCSQAHQIAGRAGRHGSRWETGFVTTYRAEDHGILEKLLATQPPELEAAGLHPTADQMEMYAYHLPNATLSNLMDIFKSLSKVDDSMYFMCLTDSFKFLADMIQHVPLPLRVRYVFSCAPIDIKIPFVCNMFLKFARQYSCNRPIQVEWLCQQLGWPFASPTNLLDLVHLEHVFDVLDLYMWLSYRFPDLLPDSAQVREIQAELDAIIQVGVVDIVRLLSNTDASRVADSDQLSSSHRRNAHKLQSQSGSVDDPDDAVDGSDNLSSAGSSKLSQRLLAQGLLTPEMMRELREEWANARPSRSSRSRLDKRTR